MRVNCGTEHFPMASEGDTAVYELHSATSNGCDERICGASACNYETEHVVVGSKGCRSFPLVAATKVLFTNFMLLMNTESEDPTVVVVIGCITKTDHGY